MVKLPDVLPWDGSAEEIGEALLDMTALATATPAQLRAGLEPSSPATQPGWMASSARQTRYRNICAARDWTRSAKPARSRASSSTAWRTCSATARRCGVPVHEPGDGRPAHPVAGRGYAPRTPSWASIRRAPQCSRGPEGALVAHVLAGLRPDAAPAADRPGCVEALR